MVCERSSMITRAALVCSSRRVLPGAATELQVTLARLGSQQRSDPRLISLVERFLVQRIETLHIPARIRLLIDGHKTVHGVPVGHPGSLSMWH